MTARVQQSFARASSRKDEPARSSLLLGDFLPKFAALQPRSDSRLPPRTRRESIAPTGNSMSLLPDIEITVHELVLDQPSLRKIQGEGRPNVWVEVDPLGLAEELDLKQLKSSRARAVHTTISVSLHESVAIEPSEPIWAPLIEALLTEEEQDSDVYFVVRAAESAEHAATPGAEDAKGITDVGTAHLNLEDLLKRAHEPNHEQLPVLAEDGTPVGKLSVSFRCLDAMRFANARKNAADAGGERLGIEVSVQRASLNAKEMVRLEDVLRKRKLKVEVEPAWSATSTALSSRKVPIADGKATFNYQVSVDVAPGTSGLTMLLEALEPAATTTPASKAKAKPDDEEDFSEVNFTLVASGSGSGERDRELGSAGVSLKALLAAGADVVDTQIKLTDESGGTTREIGTLTVSVRALELLTILRSAATGLSDALKPPTLKSLLEAHLARAASKKPPAISATSKRVEFATKADEEAMLQKVGTAATSADAARQMLDELNVRSLPQMVQQLTKNTDEKSDAHAERIRSALDATVETAHKILNSGCGAKRNDFHHDYWPQKRIEKLWHLATLLAARGDVSQRTALVATQQLALQAKLETGAASASLGRYRRRLAEARQPVTVPPLGRRREMAAVQEAFACGRSSPRTRSSCAACIIRSSSLLRSTRRSPSASTNRRCCIPGRALASERPDRPIDRHVWPSRQVVRRGGRAAARRGRRGGWSDSRRAARPRLRRQAACRRRRGAWRVGRRPALPLRPLARRHLVQRAIRPRMEPPFANVCELRHPSRHVCVSAEPSARRLAAVGPARPRHRDDDATTRRLRRPRRVRDLHLRAPAAAQRRSGPARARREHPPLVPPHAEHASAARALDADANGTRPRGD